jgi:3D (Asp-Asp-Asp) domain-containing protein/LysM repeat protein
MRKILFFMITLFLFFPTTVKSEQEENSSNIKNTTTILPEVNNSKKQQDKKTIKKTIQNNNFIKPKTKKIFLVSELNKNKTDTDSLDYISLKENIKFPISFKSIYVVKSGDTLGQIAKKFGVGQGEIQILNPQVDFNILPIGKEIVMPLSQSKINEIEKQNSKLGNEQEFDKKIIFAPSGRQMRVMASAYTSHANQTDGSPFVGAWGHRFAPGMKILAVSNDLIRDYGITNGTKIKIDGLGGQYIVRDKMNKRYTKHIDIYMGLDRARALKWGRRSVMIYW